MANLVYNNGKKIVVDWSSGGLTFRVLLTNASYVPNIDTHVFVADVTNELSGGAYVRKDIANRSIVVDTANDRVDYKGDNVTWTALNAGTAAWAVLFRLVTNDADSPLIAAIDIPDTVTNGTDFTIRWDAQASNGTLFRIS